VLDVASLALRAVGALFLCAQPLTWLLCGWMDGWCGEWRAACVKLFSLKMNQMDHQRHVKPDDVRVLMSEYCTRRHLEPGEQLFRHGDRASSIFFVDTGHVALFYTTETGAKRGFRNRIQSVTPGGIVGDLDFVLSEPRGFGCEATETSTVFELTHAAHIRLQKERVDIAFALAKVQLRDMCAHVKDVSFRTLQT